MPEHRLTPYFLRNGKDLQIRIGDGILAVLGRRFAAGRESDKRMQLWDRLVIVSDTPRNRKLGFLGQVYGDPWTRLWDQIWNQIWDQIWGEVDEQRRCPEALRMVCQGRWDA